MTISHLDTKWKFKKLFELIRKLTLLQRLHFWPFLGLWSVESRTYSLFGEKVRSEAGEAAIAKATSQEHEQNTPETVHLIARAVGFLRMCNISELKKVHTTIYTNSEIKAQSVMETCLAVAGTKNTVQHLIHHIQKKTISPLRAAELLKSIQETLFSSEHIADLLIELAQSPLAKGYEPLRQSAWLAAGSVVRGFASMTQDLPLARPATHQFKEKYIRVFMQHFRSAESTYEKVLALKTLGNAGIDMSVNELVQLIQDTRQPLAIRTEAVDALRLLKDVMPRKIQKVLLPVYKNLQNKPELRMAALWRMMETLPEEPVLAHIVSQMEKESNQHVAAFTYNVIRQFASSTNPCTQSLTVRCSNILLFTRYQPQEQNLSTYAQLPIFQSDMLSGVQFDFATIFEKNSFLPKEIHAFFESLFGDNWLRNKTLHKSSSRPSRDFPFTENSPMNSVPVVFNPEFRCSKRS
ncbi:hypothetical protein GCK72_023943 [Caenorhabditis remanei]|uniref:Vitellogenin domain-containing protein n=1 Tax=Caenorhabditis remanei TaxID=31234 RepID=A0A6A5FXU2_CAERE|nr:hypothetical protein GCK72_023943 [Caenorhabditis remanei]KAF1747480.1 hypothetical protein GCK72_023943 [Caenorhabditis remanei]